METAAAVRLRGQILDIERRDFGDAQERIARDCEDRRVAQARKIAEMRRKGSGGVDLLPADADNLAAAPVSGCAPETGKDPLRCDANRRDMAQEARAELCRGDDEAGRGGGLAMLKQVPQVAGQRPVVECSAGQVGVQAIERTGVDAPGLRRERCFGERPRGRRERREAAGGGWDGIGHLPRAGPNPAIVPILLLVLLTLVPEHRQVTGDVDVQPAEPLVGQRPHQPGRSDRWIERLARSAPMTVGERFIPGPSGPLGNVAVQIVDADGDVSDPVTDLVGRAVCLHAQTLAVQVAGRYVRAQELIGQHRLHQLPQK